MELEKYKKAEEIRHKIADLEHNLKMLKQSYWNDSWMKIDAHCCDVQHTSPIYLDEEWSSKIRNFIIETSEKEINELNNEFEII